MKADSSSQRFPFGRAIAGIQGSVKHENAEHSLLLLLVGFAGSIIATRSFLELTGYPQIATGDFHIAHVLWGGLLLFAASLLLLIWRGQNLYWLSSLLTGIGFGLFIDEVGKFITQTNDYFYPLAAPIIYAAFLLVVLIYTRVRRLQKEGVQAETYALLNSLERGIDPHLSGQEYDHIKLRLGQIAGQSIYPNVARLAVSVLDFIETEHFPGVPTQSGFLDRWRARLAAAEARWVTPTRLKLALILGLVVLGLRGVLASIATFLLVSEIADPAVWQQIASTLWTGGERFGTTRLLLVLVGLTLESVIGGLLLTAALLLIIRHLRLGLVLGYWGLLFSLTAVQLLMFYFNQFDVIVTTVLQFSLLFGILRYRARQLDS
jgi:hypothetical protein